MLGLKAAAIFPIAFVQVGLYSQYKIYQVHGMFYFAIVLGTPKYTKAP